MDLFKFIRDRLQTQRFSRNEKLAYEKGYRIKDGILYSPTGVRMKLRKNGSGYLCFSFPVGSRTDNSRKMLKVFFHRLVAYQEYGDLLYNFDCARHKDGNKLNNSPENIKPGSQKLNCSEIPEAVRKQSAIKASSHLRRFSNDMVAEIKDQHVSYKKTMLKYGISSKGTLWEILNRDYVTEKSV